MITIIPNYTGEDAEVVLDSFTDVMQREIAAVIEKNAEQRMEKPECFDLTVSAGITSVTHNDAISDIIERASGSKKIIARFRCDSEKRV